ncbi:MAG: tandem-95 repeat protein, partial [Holophagaceae bacterium]
TYTVTSGGVTETATVSVTVSAVADIAADTVSTSEDSAVTSSVLSNDSFAGSKLVTSVGPASHGTVSTNGTTVTYTPNADYNGTDSYTYTVTSGGVTETATVSVTVTAVADVSTDTLSMAEDTAITANVITGTNGASADSFEGTPTLTAVTQGAHGAVTYTGAGAVTYTPDADYNGTDSYTYTVTSPAGITETATVNVTVTAVADIAADTVSTNEDSAVTTSVLGNDSFAAGKAVSAVSAASHGTVSTNGTTVTYTPNADYNGSDSYTYTVTSGGVTETATVSVTVVAINDAPANTVPAAQTINEDATLTFSSANSNLISVSDSADTGHGGTDTISTTVSVARGTLMATTGGSATIGNNGTASVTLSGTAAQVNAALAGLVYTPTANYNGSDTLTIVTTDSGNTGTGGALTDTDTVAITVTAVNDAPVSTADTVTVLEDTATVLSLTDFGSYSDVEATAIAGVQITTLESLGTLEYNNGTSWADVTLDQAISAADITAGKLRYTAGINANGANYATIGFKVYDGTDYSASAYILTVSVTAVNDAPAGADKT